MGIQDSAGSNKRVSGPWLSLADRTKEPQQKQDICDVHGTVCIDIAVVTILLTTKAPEQL